MYIFTCYSQSHALLPPLCPHDMGHILRTKILDKPMVCVNRRLQSWASQRNVGHMASMEKGRHGGPFLSGSMRWKVLFPAWKAKFQESASKWEKETETVSLPSKSYSDHLWGFMRPGERGCERPVSAPYGTFSSPHFLEERPWLQPQDAYSPRSLKLERDYSCITGLSSSFHQLTASFSLFFYPVHDSKSSLSAPRPKNTKMNHTEPALSPTPSQPSASITAIIFMEVMMHSTMHL